MLLKGLSQPRTVMPARPSMPMAMASAHWRRRVASRISTQSLMAPMVQKWLRWITAPSTRPSANARPRTSRPRASNSLMDTRKRPSAQLGQTVFGGLGSVGLRVVLHQVFERFARGLAVLEFKLHVRDGQHGFGRAQVRGRQVQHLAKLGQRFLVVLDGIGRVAQPEQCRRQIPALGVALHKALQGRLRSGEIAFAESLKRAFVVAFFALLDLEFLAIDLDRDRVEEATPRVQ